MYECIDCWEKHVADDTNPSRTKCPYCKGDSLSVPMCKDKNGDWILGCNEHKIKAEEVKVVPQTSWH